MDERIYGTYSELGLFRPGDSQMPSGIGEYERNKGAWENIAGVVEPGTLIQISQILLEHNPEMGDSVRVKGKILNVSWAKKPAELYFISKRIARPRTENSPSVGPADFPTLDPNILELVRGDF